MLLILTQFLTFSPPAGWCGLRAGVPEGRDEQHQEGPGGHEGEEGEGGAGEHRPRSQAVPGK